MSFFKIPRKQRGQLSPVMNAIRTGVSRNRPSLPWLPHAIRFVVIQMLTCTGYIGDFEIIDDHRAGKIVVQLIGRINKCGVISPRYPVPLNEIEGWVSSMLPARSFGFVVLTTSSGIMDHEEARRKHVAGKILGYFY